MYYKLSSIKSKSVKLEWVKLTADSYGHHLHFAFKKKRLKKNQIIDSSLANRSAVKICLGSIL